jgi:hypothetical protein
MSGCVPALPAGGQWSRNPLQSQRFGRPRALTKADVAQALGVSVDFVEDHVWQELRLVRRGRKTFVSVAELQAWLERSSQRTLAG